MSKQSEAKERQGYVKVEKGIRWYQLFGESGPDMSEKTRRARWEKWKKLISAGEQHVVDYWAKDHIEESCSGCVNKDGDWCKAVGLPCNVNPVLTFSIGLIGMACMGMAKRTIPEQLQLF